MALNSILNSFSGEQEVVKKDNKYVESDKDEVSLKVILQRARLKQMKEKALTPRGVSFAPSMITYSFCRRLKVAQLAGLVDMYYDRFTPSVQTGYDLGTWLHDLVQTYFWNVGLLKGSFECLKCDKTYHDIVSPKVCPSGKTTHKRKHLRFKEVFLKNEEYLLVGRCDGFIAIENDPILEIKSLTCKPAKSTDRAFYFEDLDKRGPVEKHIVQLNLYMLMAKKEEGHLFYICKNTGRIKTFHIKYDQKIVQPYLNEIRYLIDTAAALKLGEDVELPECCGEDTCACHSIVG